MLTPQAVRGLFATLRALAATGLGVLFVSHKLEEIRALAQRCTILRGGRVVARVDPRAHSSEALARLMVGREPPRLASHDTPPGCHDCRSMACGWRRVARRSRWRGKR